MKKIFFFLMSLCLALFIPLAGFSQIITTFAGDGISGYVGNGSLATAAELGVAIGIAVDVHNNVYIADAGSQCIRMVNTSGIIVTVAGNGDGAGLSSGTYSGDGSQATAAGLSNPADVAVDAMGNLFIADADNNVIRKVNTSGIISTIAGNGSYGYGGDGGPATEASMSSPSGVAVDAAGNLYIADRFNNCVRKVNTLGIIATVAGDDSEGYSGDGGVATLAKLNLPQNVVIDGSGNMYISDVDNNRIRKVSSSGIITTFAGNGIPGFSGDGGSATLAKINTPNGISMDAYGNLLITDAGNQRIRVVNGDGIITTIAGNGTSGYNGDDIDATAASLQFPNFVAVDNSGNIYISDYLNYRVRRFSILTEGVSELVHSGDGISIYPNPCNGNFYINVSSQVQEDASITVTNSIGQVVREIYAPTNQPIAVKMDEPEGIYLLHTITTSFGSWYEKIVLVK